MEKLTKFEYWVQRTLPQVYDDSLSFYELLNKVVAYLNEVIESQNLTIEEVENVKALQIALQNHVDNYFNNLNVQNEINAKLDEMTADGTMDTIINHNIFNANVSAAPNRPMKVLAGVIEPDDLGTWGYITETFHTPMNFSSISQQIDRIRVDYAFAANKVNALVAVPDETFIMHGLQCGTSVNDTYAEIKMYMPLSAHIKGRSTVQQAPSWFKPVLSLTNTSDGCGFELNHPHTFTDDVPIVSGMGANAAIEPRITAYTDRKVTVTAFSDFAGTVAYNGSSWAVTSPNVTPLTFSFDSVTGTLTVTHDKFVNANDIQLTPRGNLIPVLAVISDTQFTVQFKDYAGNVVLNPTTDMRFFYHSGQKVKTLYPADMEVSIRRGNCVLIPANVTTASGNIWLLGTHEVLPTP